MSEATNHCAESLVNDLTRRLGEKLKSLRFWILVLVVMEGLWELKMKGPLTDREAEYQGEASGVDEGADHEHGIHHLLLLLVTSQGGARMACPWLATRLVLALPKDPFL